MLDNNLTNASTLEVRIDNPEQLTTEELNCCEQLTRELDILARTQIFSGNHSSLDNTITTSYLIGFVQTKSWRSVEKKLSNINLPSSYQNKWSQEWLQQIAELRKCKERYDNLSHQLLTHFNNNSCEKLQLNNSSDAIQDYLINEVKKSKSNIEKFINQFNETLANDIKNPQLTQDMNCRKIIFTIDKALTNFVLFSDNPSYSMDEKQLLVKVLNPITLDESKLLDKISFIFHAFIEIQLYSRLKHNFPFNSIPLCIDFKYPSPEKIQQGRFQIKVTICNPKREIIAQKIAKIAFIALEEINKNLSNSLNKKSINTKTKRNSELSQVANFFKDLIGIA